MHGDGVIEIVQKMYNRKNKNKDKKKQEWRIW